MGRMSVAQTGGLQARWENSIWRLAFRRKRNLPGIVNLLIPPVLCVVKIARFQTALPTVPVNILTDPHIAVHNVQF